MKTVRVYLAALLLALGCSAVQADETKGLYIGAGVGQFNLEIDDAEDAFAAADNFDSDDTSWKIFAGWRFSPFLALELDYIDFGGPEDQGITAEINGFAPYLVATIPLGIFEASGHLGYYFYDVDIDTDTLDASDSSEDLVYGISLGLVLFEHLNTRLMYEIIDISEVEDSNALWLTGAWRF